jgi:acyl carrier protein
MQNSLEQLSVIFKSVFGKQTEITSNTHQNDIPEWDSLNHLSLILELESKFQLGLTPDEIEKIKSVRDILNLFEKRENS